MLADSQTDSLAPGRRRGEGIKALVAAPPDCLPIDLEKAMPWGRVKMGRERVPGQWEAHRQALGSRELVITGGLGVGKRQGSSSVRARSARASNSWEKALLVAADIEEVARLRKMALEDPDLEPPSMIP